MNLADILTGAHVALRLIQARLITVIALLLAFVLFAWAMWSQTTLGAIIAAIWGLTIFLPVLFAGRGGYDGASTQRPQRSREPEEGESSGS